MHKTRKLSTVTAFVAVFAVALAGMAWADNLVNDGDLLTADAQSLNFGDVCAGAEVTAPAEHWVTKQGPTSAWSNFFANSATVTFTVVSASSGLSAEMDDDPSTVTLPSNWRTSTNGTASAKVSSTVTLVAPAATGAFSGTVTYNASAPFGTDGTTSRTETLNVSANVINCAPPATEPTVNHTLSPGSPNGTNGWYRSAVSINWVITGEPAPALTGCASGPFSADGDYSESCTAVNSAGQASDTAVFKIDQTAPTVAFTSATAGVGNGPNAADWFKAPVTATFTATDNLSGFNAARTLTTTGAANSGSNEGSDVVIQSPVFTDWAGNTAAAGTASQSFKIDLSDPYNVAFVGGPDADASYVFGSIPAAPTCTADDASPASPVASSLDTATRSGRTR